jgi:diguanylate cyclase (GGDEF)-like protein/PAS domain S-box-containing protein
MVHPSGYSSERHPSSTASSPFLNFMRNFKNIGHFFGNSAKNKIGNGRHLIDYVSRINELKAEIELLTSYSTDVIYRLRYDGMRYDYVSPSVVRLLGYSPDEMRDLNFRSLIRETRIVTDGMRKVNSFSQLEENRLRGDVNKWQADYLMKTKDGRLIWVADISYPWFDRNGNIIGSVGSLRDISDRIAAEEKAKEELARIANTDVLTGLPNRRAFFDRLDADIKRARRNGSPLSILLIDIDHFKQVNDRFGHDMGDHVIRQTARIIRECLRETDVPSRLGGEEFGVYLPDTPTEGAYWVAERIRSSIAKHDFGMSGSPIGCTVSIGVGDTGNDMSMIDSTQLYKIADTRLYIAKNTGRNQVSMDEIIAMH